MKRCLFLLLFNFIPSLVSSAETPSEFMILQGMQSSSWVNVNEDDGVFLEKFNRLFDLNVNSELDKRTIPKKIHFIWIGPKEFPSTSIKNVNSWIEKHENYETYFWTDRERPLPHPKMIVRKLDNFDWKFLESHFNDSNNFAEKSDLMRYEILFQEGGVYVDHDVECYKSLDRLIEKYDFFCALERPHKPIGTTTVEACNNLIGTCKNHPILHNAILRSQKDWEYYKQTYSADDFDSTIKRVYFRTFRAFGEAVKKDVFDSNFKNIVFPAGFFNRIDGNFGIYANHFYASTWFNPETKFENNTRKRLLKICRKNNQIILITSFAFLLVTLLVLILFLQLRSIKKIIRNSFLDKK